MQTISQLAEIVFRRINPNAADSPNKLGEYVSMAKALFAERFFIFSKEQKRSEGGFEIPGFMLSGVNVSIRGGSIDVSAIKHMKTSQADDWIHSINPMGNDECEYGRVSYTNYKLSVKGRNSGIAPFYLMGKEIKFPEGVPDKDVELIYVGDGSNMKDSIGVPDDMAASIMRDLYNFYVQKQSEDKANNNNSQ